MTYELHPQIIPKRDSDQKEPNDIGDTQKEGVTITGTPEKVVKYTRNYGTGAELLQEYQKRGGARQGILEKGRWYTRNARTRAELCWLVLNKVGDYVH